MIPYLAPHNYIVVPPQGLPSILCIAKVVFCTSTLINFNMRNHILLAQSLLRPNNFCKRVILVFDTFEWIIRTNQVLIWKEVSPRFLSIRDMKQCNFVIFKRLDVFYEYMISCLFVVSVIKLWHFKRSSPHVSSISLRQKTVLYGNSIHFTISPVQ